MVSLFQRILLPVAALLLVFSLSFAVYSPLKDNPTHFDDIFHINIPVTEEITPLPKFFISDEELGNDVPHRGMMILLNALCRSVTTEEENFQVYYSVGIAIHALNAWLLMLFVSLLWNTFTEGKDKQTVSGSLVAFFAGLLFLLHPVELNVVGYLAQKSSLLVTFFGLLSLVLFLVSLREERFSFLLRFSALLFYSAALWSKETGITLLLPFSFLLWEKKKEVNTVLKEMLPFYVLGAVYLFHVSFSTFTELFDATPFHYFLTQIVVLVSYLSLLLFPQEQRLNFDWDIPLHTGLDSAVFGGILLHLFLIAVAFRMLTKKEWKLCGFGILWFYIVISPDSSIMPLPERMVEYRLYLPSIGFFIALTAGTGIALRRFSGSLKLQALFFCILFIPLGAYYFSVVQKRLPVLDSEIAFWSDVIEKSPDKARGYTNRGYAYQKKGEVKKAYKDYNKAIALGTEKYDPAMMYLNRASLYMSFNLLKDAIEDYNTAIALTTSGNDPQPYFHRGIAYGRMKEFEKAKKSFTEAIKISPEPVFYFQRGRAEQYLNQHREAIRDFNRALPLHTNAKVLYNRGMSYRALGNEEKAENDLNEAKRLESALNARTS